MIGKRRATSRIVRMTCLADGRGQEVELGGVVPREAGPVVAVVDVALVAGLAVEPLEHDRGIAVVPVVVLEDDPDARRRTTGPRPVNV